MPKQKPKKISKSKLSFKKPVLIFAVLFAVIGIYMTFNTSAASVGPKDQYGCPRDYAKRPNLILGSKGMCVYTVQAFINSYWKIGGTKLALAVDGNFGPKTQQAVLNWKKHMIKEDMAGTWVPKLLEPDRTVKGDVGKSFWYWTANWDPCVSPWWTKECSKPKPPAVGFP